MPREPRRPPPTSGADGATLLEVTRPGRSTSRSAAGLLQRQVGAVQAVDGLDFAVAPGETLALVGESGCGKTTTGRLLTRLLEPTGGQVVFEGQRHHPPVARRSMRPLRRDVQMIFQDPYSSLNPRHTVGTIVGAPFRLQNIKTEQRRQEGGPGPARAGRPQPGALQPLPARVLRRPAPAHRHRPRARPQAEADRRATSRSRRSTCRSRRRSSTCSRTSRTSSA